LYHSVVSLLQLPVLMPRPPPLLLLLLLLL
jgi:hypothetical protein